MQDINLTQITQFLADWVFDSSNRWNSTTV